MFNGLFFLCSKGLPAAWPVAKCCVIPKACSVQKSLLRPDFAAALPAGNGNCFSKILLFNLAADFLDLRRLRQPVI
jgi:hypothetical protein